MKTISVMIDCSRNAVPNIQFLKSFILYLEKCGFNQLQLYTEDVYEIKGEPFFGYFRGRYTNKEIKEVDAFASEHGITLVPAIQLLGHLNNIFHWGEYKDVHDLGDCLLVDEEKTYVLIEKMLKQIRSMYKTNLINIGLDESFYSGLGEHLNRYGYENPNDIYFRHLKRIAKLLDKFKLTAMMWGDMFYRNTNKWDYYTKDPKLDYRKIKKLLSKNIHIIYWDYFTLDKEIIDSMSKSAKRIDNDALFATGAWTWIGYAPRTDFAIKQINASLPIIKKNKIEHAIITMWGDKGGECSKLAALPALYYFASTCKGISDIDKIKSNFRKAFNFDFDVFNYVNNINKIDGKVNWNNPCKYMLFNNLIAGIYDNTVLNKDTIKFLKSKNLYKKLINNKQFGYIFKTLALLADALYIKYPLGIKIRNAYHSKNKKELTECVKELKILKIKLNEFYEAFKAQWHFENKPEGFEIQTFRIGGLIKHIDDVAILLNKYINGDIKKINQLEQKILPFKGVKKGDTLMITDPNIAFSVNNF